MYRIFSHNSIVFHRGVPIVSGKNDLFIHADLMEEYLAGVGSVALPLSQVRRVPGGSDAAKSLRLRSDPEAAYPLLQNSVVSTTDQNRKALIALIDEASSRYREKKLKNHGMPLLSRSLKNNAKSLLKRVCLLFNDGPSDGDYMIFAPRFLVPTTAFSRLFDISKDELAHIICMSIARQMSSLGSIYSFNVFTTTSITDTAKDDDRSREKAIYVPILETMVDGNAIVEIIESFENALTAIVDDPDSRIALNLPLESRIGMNIDTRAYVMLPPDIKKYIATIIAEGIVLTIAMNGNSPYIVNLFEALPTIGDKTAEWAIREV